MEGSGAATVSPRNLSFRVPLHVQLSTLRAWAAQQASDRWSLGFCSIAAVQLG